MLSPLSLVLPQPRDAVPALSPSPANSAAAACTCSKMGLFMWHSRLGALLGGVRGIGDQRAAAQRFKRGVTLSRDAPGIFFNFFFIFLFCKFTPSKLWAEKPFSSFTGGEDVLPSGHRVPQRKVKQIHLQKLGSEALRPFLVASP